MSALMVPSAPYCVTGWRRAGGAHAARYHESPGFDATERLMINFYVRDKALEPRLP